MWVGDKPNVINVEVTLFAKTLESPKDTDVFLIATGVFKVKIGMDWIYVLGFFLFGVIVVG